MFAGIDNKNLNRKDRLSLLSRTQVMYINGKPITEIEQFARSFSEPREMEFPKIGGEFSQLMGTLGYLSGLLFISIHWAGL
jgi:hypothetical protein